MKRILIIDDDAMIRGEVRHALTKANYEVLEASKPSDGLLRAQSEQPDLILLDILMPEMDGVCVLRQLRQDSATSGIPVIMVTSLDSEDQVAACLEEGAVDHISKPFSHRMLCARVSACLMKRLYSVVADEAEAGAASNHETSVIAFLGANGGVGTTTLAANAASAAALNNQSVILCELQSTCGSLSLQLNTHPRDHLGTLLESLDKLASDDLDRFLIRDSSGLQILFGPRPDDLDIKLEASQAQAVIDALRPRAQLIFLDLDVGLTDVNVEILKLCDRVVLVVDCEPTSVAAARCTIDQLQHASIRHSIKVVIVKRTALTLPPKIDDIRSFLGCDLIGVVPPAADGIAFAVSAGATLITLQPTDDMSTAIRRMTEMHLQLAIPAVH